MAYTFSTKDRYSAVTFHRLLSSPGVVLVILAAAIVNLSALGVWYIADTPSVFILGFAAVAAAIAGFALLLFVFATTYYPFAKPPTTTRELIGAGKGNVADAAAFDFVRHIGPFANKPTPESLSAAVEELFTNQHGDDLMRRLELDTQSVVQAVRADVLPHADWAEFADLLLKIAASMDQSYLEIEHAQAAFLLHPNLKTFLRRQEYTEQDIVYAVWWRSMQKHEDMFKARWWARERLLSFTGVGLSWASGYTPFVDQFARLPQGSLWDLPLGHETQVEKLIDALARQRQSNVLVVGQPGAGRLGVVKEMARRVNTSRAHRALNGQRVMYVHTGQLLGLAATGAGQLSVITRALTEMERAGNVIAILDGLTSLIGGQGETTGNLTDVIMPFFSSDSVRVVAIMSSDEYHLRFKSNQDLLQLFEVVHVEPLSPEQTLQLLSLSVPRWEARTGVYLPYKTLRAIVKNTGNILPEIPFPEKAFDVLEESLVMIQRQPVDVLTEAHVNSIISNKIGFNVGKLEDAERTQLLGLENTIHRRVVNQEKGVAAVARAMVRARAGVRSGKRPIGTFIFLGPTGVGKTETSKALAEAYFGSEDYLQRLDMSEYQGPDAVGRLIGTADAPTGNLTSLIADHPFSVLLLDEFEKADKNVHQLFLQVFDEGRLTDVRGREYSFRHTIMIATSNAGAEFIRSTVSQTGTLPDDFDQQLREHILRKQLFRPELLNRFDGVITFTPLTKEHLRKIAKLMLRKLNKRLDDQHGITVTVSEELIDFLISIGYNPEFGARPMNRAIQNTIEYAVAQQVLKNQITPGQEVTLPIQSLQKIHEQT